MVEKVTRLKDLTEQEQIEIINKIFDSMPDYKKEIYYRNFESTNYWR